MKDGGPAFPQRRDIDGTWPHMFGAGGMSLRDYFAAKAMQAMAVDPMYTNSDVSDWIGRAAKMSYKYADAMLKAREQ